LLVYPEQNRQKVPETLNRVIGLFNVNALDEGSIQLYKNQDKFRTVRNMSEAFPERRRQSQ
jgi:hypothetical protein